MQNGPRWRQGGVIKILINSKSAKFILSVKNKTYKEAAESMGISEEHFCRLMSGKHQPRPSTRKALCTKIFVGVPWDKLFIMNSATSEVVA